MKKSCQGCRAFEPSSAGDATCALGHAIESIRVPVPAFGTSVQRGKPKEECPKPKTYDALLAAKGIPS